MFPRTLLLSLVVFFAGCRSQIQHGLEERDANEIVTELTTRGFEVKKVPEKGKKPTWAIELDDDKSTDALRVLTELKLANAADPPVVTTLSALRVVVMRAGTKVTA